MSPVRALVCTLPRTLQNNSQTDMGHTTKPNYVNLHQEGPPHEWLHRHWGRGVWHWGLWRSGVLAACVGPPRAAPRQHAPPPCTLPFILRERSWRQGTREIKPSLWEVGEGFNGHHLVELHTTLPFTTSIAWQKPNNGLDQYELKKCSINILCAVNICKQKGTLSFVCTLQMKAQDCF